MKAKLTFIKELEINNPRTEVTSCFWIEAMPVMEEVEDVDANLEEEITFEVCNSAKLVANFRTVLFPNNVKFMEQLQLLSDKFTAWEERETDELPKMPFIYLDRYEVGAPEPYFRRFMTDGDDHVVGDWILAGSGDVFDPRDPLKRKVFTSLVVTCLCDKELNAEGIYAPRESVNEKATRSWREGVKISDTHGCAMFAPVEETLKLETKRTISETKEVVKDVELLSDTVPPIKTTERRRL